MAGGGGRDYIPPSTGELRKKLEEARAAEQRRLDQAVADYLGELLARFNDRDVDATRERLGELASMLGEEAEVDQLLLGGSVSKHTYVNGLSDVDALVVLSKEDLGRQTPESVLEQFYVKLRDGLTSDTVEKVTQGVLAVTVKYRDGAEIQLLPATRKGDKIRIADATGKRWKEIEPRRFKEKLTRANDRMSGRLIPAIKLAKAAVADWPEDRRVSGYHLEALALDATRAYAGERTVKSLLLRILDHSASRVGKPLKDVTGQSGNVDSYLGKAGSSRRGVLASTFRALARRLAGATSIGQWRATLQEKEDP